MVRTRYIGSSRLREAGFSATHKQDFTSHITGGDWIHLAEHINVAGDYDNLQDELNAFESWLWIMPSMVTGPEVSTSDRIAVFSGTSGKVLKESQTSLDPDFGDLLLPSGASDPLGEGYSIITKAQINRAQKGESLYIYGQHNNGGEGGDLVLGSGFNAVSMTYDGDISLYSSNLVFSAAQSNPHIYQADNTGAVGEDLVISAQNSTVSTGGDLYLRSGTGLGGTSGYIHLESDNINLSCPNGIVKVNSNYLWFDPTLFGVQISQPLTNNFPGDLLIASQSGNYSKGSDISIWSGAGFYLEPIHYPGDDGDVNIYAGWGQVNIGGTANGGSGGVNLIGAVFLPDMTAPGTPTDGVYIYASGGDLYCKGTNGIAYQLNT
jgi:hypothetical protein